MPENSLSRTVVVTDPSGVHARTAVSIADVVRRGRSRVALIKDERRVAGTEVLQIMTMVAEQGDKITIEAAGADAAEVLDALEPLFAGRFGDEVDKSA